MNEGTLDAANTLAQTVNTWPIITAAIVLIGVALIVTAVVIVYGSKFIVRMAEINAKNSEEYQRRIRALETDSEQTVNQLAIAVRSLTALLDQQKTNLDKLLMVGSTPVQNIDTKTDEILTELGNIKMSVKTVGEKQDTILTTLGRVIPKLKNAATEAESIIHDTGELKAINPNV